MDDRQDLGALSGSREPSPVARSRPTGFDPERIVRAFNERLRVYRTKRDGSPPFGEDCYNKQEAYQLVTEAIELLALEAGLAAVVPAENRDD